MGRIVVRIGSNPLIQLIESRINIIDGWFNLKWTAFGFNKITIKPSFELLIRPSWTIWVLLLFYPLFYQI